MDRFLDSRFDRDSRMIETAVAARVLLPQRRHPGVLVRIRALRYSVPQEVSFRRAKRIETLWRRREDPLPFIWELTFHS